MGKLALIETNSVRAFDNVKIVSLPFTFLFNLIHKTFDRLIQFFFIHFILSFYCSTDSSVSPLNSNLVGLFGSGVQKSMSLIDSSNSLRSTIYNDATGTYITSRNFATGTATRLGIRDNHLYLSNFTFTVNPDGSFNDVSTGTTTIV